MKFEQIEPLNHVIGDNETINLAKSAGVTARSFEIVNTSLVSFHFENISTTSPRVYGSAGSYIQKIDEDEVREASIPSRISSENGTFASALLEPGKYRVIFQHIGSMGPEYIHFYSKKIDFKTLSVENMDLSGFPTYNFTTLDFEDVTLPIWENYPNTYGATYPIGFNFSIDENFWDYGYNISIHADKNSDLFDDYITPDLAFLLDDSSPGSDDYIDYTDAIQPGNAQKVPVITEVNPGGDALIFGSYDKFDRIEVTLADAADDDDFVWQYYKSDGPPNWENIINDDSDFVDGTRSTTGSLNKSGTISWDPNELPDWEPINSGSNTSTLPYTDGQEYYLIRVLCNDNSAAMANITSVNLRKYVKIEFDLESRLAFNIGTSEKPVYYTASDRIKNNILFTSTIGKEGFMKVTGHDIDKNYFSDEAILYLYAKDIELYDYNGSSSGIGVPLEKPLTFSVCVFQPENYKQIIDYNISTNNATTHLDQLNMTTLAFDKDYSLDIPDRLTLYLNITPRTLYDWTQINVQFVNATVMSTKLILPARYDLNSAGTYIDNYDNGVFNLGLTGITDMNASIEFGFITETVFIEFVIENTTNNPAIFKVFGSQFDYSMLTVLEVTSETNWVLYGGIGGGVVVLVAVSVIIYKKKHPV